MTPVTFLGYGVQATEITIIAERVVSWSQIDFNGSYGTEIYLDTGNPVRVKAWPREVEKKIIDAMQPEKDA